MKNSTRFRTLAIIAVLGLSSLVAIVLPDPAGAVPNPSPTPPFTQCPAVGHDTSCQKLITVNADGTVTVLTDPLQPAYDNQEDSLVGVVNNSNALLAGLSLTGPGIFALDNDGLCTATPTPCPSGTTYGPTGYEGPGTVLTPSGSSSGAVGLTGNLAPGASAYFSLEQAGISGASASLLPNISLSASPVAGTEGTAFAGTVATFTDPPSAAPASAFSATIDWGDGSSGPGTVSPTGGGYAVSGTHTYAEKNTYATSVTVTDTHLALNTATASGTATIGDAPITVTGSPVAAQTTGTSFTVPLATFTDANPTAPLSDFTASIDWGDGTTGTGAVTQPGGTGTTFGVGGTHAYASHGTYTATVTVTDGDGATASVTDTVAVADIVTTCSTSGCNGSITTTTQSLQLSSTSTTGTIQTTLDPGAGGFSCGDPFRHAPQTTTVTDTGLGANITFTVTFANASVPGRWFVPFAVCYQAQTPFKDLFGHTVTTGLLPICSLPLFHRTAVAPCVQSITELPFKLGKVVEKIVVPAGDPRYH